MEIALKYLMAVIRLHFTEIVYQMYMLEEEIQIRLQALEKLLAQQQQLHME